jgi:4'-phosphopantetheinyl transferase
VGADEVRVELAVPESVVDPDERSACEALLSPGERERAARMHGAGAERRFVVAHALVRSALSRCAPVPPERWRFRAGENGRPEIEGPAAGAGLRFNLSHTEGLAACAVVREHALGVDVEAGARLRDPLALAERFFAPHEAAALRALPEAERRERFLAAWTAKEAYLKARGLGIAGRLAAVALELGGGPPRLALGGALEDDARAWQLALLRPTPRHHLAVALRRGDAPDLAVAVRLFSAASFLGGEGA